MNSLMQKSFLIIKRTTSVKNGVMVTLTDDHASRTYLLSYRTNNLGLRRMRRQERPRERVGKQVEKKGKKKTIS